MCIYIRVAPPSSAQLTAATVGALGVGAAVGAAVILVMQGNSCFIIYEILYV